LIFIESKLELPFGESGEIAPEYSGTYNNPYDSNTKQKLKAGIFLTLINSYHKLKIHSHKLTLVDIFLIKKSICMKHKQSTLLYAFVLNII